MEEGKNTNEKSVLNSNDLAFERTLLAENRTLMAWVRTAISLISFGFTIYKFFQETGGPTHHFFTPRKVGMIMIIFGLLALIWGLMDHRDTLKKLRKSYPDIQRSRATILAILVLLFGVVMFLGVLFRQ
jgi:putative membrane protein